MRYDATVCVCLGKQKITRRETYMHKVQPNPARHLQHAGAKVARGDFYCNRYTKID
jgi:hypothetical protein